MSRKSSPTSMRAFEISRAGAGKFFGSWSAEARRATLQAGEARVSAATRRSSPG